MLLSNQEIKVTYGQSKALSSTVPVVDVVEYALCKFSIIIFFVFVFERNVVRSVAVRGLWLLCLGYLLSREFSMF